MSKESSTAMRPRRADAVRNEEKVRRAAQQVFDTVGSALTMDDVARAAGVSKGTVYKSYPTREQLIDEMTIVHLQRSATDFRAAAASADPWAGLVAAILTPTLGVAATYDVLDLDSPTATTRPAMLDAVEALQSLLSACKRQGTVRPEITARQVITLFRGLYGELPSYSERMVESTTEYAWIILRGIRA